MERGIRLVSTPCREAAVLSPLPGLSQAEGGQAAAAASPRAPAQQMTQTRLSGLQKAAAGPEKRSAPACTGSNPSCQGAWDEACRDPGLETGRETRTSPPDTHHPRFAIVSQAPPHTDAGPGAKALLGSRSFPGRMNSEAPRSRNAGGWGGCKRGRNPHSPARDKLFKQVSSPELEDAKQKKKRKRERERGVQGNLVLQNCIRLRST